MIVSRTLYNENECVKLGTYNFEGVKDKLVHFWWKKNRLRPETKKKNCECKWSILCTSSPTKEPIRTPSKKKKEKKKDK